jgi:hypothetical protein
MLLEDSREICLGSLCVGWAGRKGWKSRNSGGIAVTKDGAGRQPGLTADEVERRTKINSNSMSASGSACQDGKNQCMATEMSMTYMAHRAGTRLWEINEVVCG